MGCMYYIGKNKPFQLYLPPLGLAPLLLCLQVCLHKCGQQWSPWSLELKNEKGTFNFVLQNALSHRNIEEELNVLKSVKNAIRNNITNR